MTDHSLSTAYLNVEDLRMFNGEARISSLTLGAALGYTRARSIRNIILTNWDEIASYGEIVAIPKNSRKPVESEEIDSGDEGVKSPQNDENSNEIRVCHAAWQTSREKNAPDNAPDEASNAIDKGGRPGIEYFFNEDQVILICIFARTEISRLIRREVIAVYKEWRRRRGEQKSEIILPSTRNSFAREIELALAPYWPSRARPKFWNNLPLRSSLIELHRVIPASECAAHFREAFGEEAPSRHAIGRFWTVLDRARGVPRAIAKRNAA